MIDKNKGIWIKARLYFFYRTKSSNIRLVKKKDRSEHVLIVYSFLESWNAEKRQINLKKSE